MGPNPMNNHSSKDSGTQCTDLSVGQMLRKWINRESTEPPPILLMIVLLVGTLWVGIFLATHWPSRAF